MLLVDAKTKAVLMNQSEARPDVSLKKLDVLFYELTNQNWKFE